VPQPRRKRSRRPRRRREPEWVEWTDDQILDLRFKDLHLHIEGTELEQRIDRVFGELEARGITKFRPHFWLSHEWFTPDGTSGIAIPFYLAHPRLKRLERNQMYEVEGGTEAWCMRILRHEVGHTLDNVYRLHHRKRYRELFGSWSVPYPKFYDPRPYSKSFVLHLDMWYAQSHPAEDFAETFAVWLRPGSGWRKRYQGWPALRKLEYVDELMKEINGTPPLTNDRKQYHPLRRQTRTLREHYREKKAHYGEEFPDFYDRDLRRLFSDDKKHRKFPTAASFIRSIKPELRKMVGKWTGEYQYTIEQVIDDIIDRCKELRLRLVRPPERIKTETLMMVTVQTMNYLHAGNHRVAL
jgi:hypothetical protein